MEVVEKNTECALSPQFIAKQKSLIEEWLREATDPQKIKDQSQSLGGEIDRLDLERRNRVIEKLNLALQTIEHGRYGTCLDCETAIPQARLEAVPHAVRCIRCQAKKEKR